MPSMNTRALTLIVGDVAKRTPDHNQNRSDGARVSAVGVRQLSVTAVVVAVSGASPGFVASSATQTVVRTLAASTLANDARG